MSGRPDMGARDAPVVPMGNVPDGAMLAEFADGLGLELSDWQYEACRNIYLPRST